MDYTSDVATFPQFWQVAATPRQRPFMRNTLGETEWLPSSFGLSSSWRKISWYSLYRRLVGFQSRLNLFEEGKHLFPLPRTDHRVLYLPALPYCHFSGLSGPRMLGRRTRYRVFIVERTPPPGVLCFLRNTPCCGSKAGQEVSVTEHFLFMAVREMLPLCANVTFTFQLFVYWRFPGMSWRHRVSALFCV
jgi:hypothetical protein